MAILLLIGQLLETIRLIFIETFGHTGHEQTRFQYIELTKRYRNDAPIKRRQKDVLAKEVLASRGSKKS